MSLFYLDRRRENDLHSLPDAEVYHLSAKDFITATKDSIMHNRLLNERGTIPNNFQAAHSLKGWYWHPCLPGCLPDSDPCGPFNTEELAIANAREDD